VAKKNHKGIRKRSIIGVLRVKWFKPLSLGGKSEGGASKKKKKKKKIPKVPPVQIATLKRGGRRRPSQRTLEDPRKPERASGLGKKLTGLDTVNKRGKPREARDNATCPIPTSTLKKPKNGGGGREKKERGKGM